MTTPTSALLAFFKTVGDAGTGACTWQDAKDRSERFLARAGELSHDAMRGELSTASKLSAADEAVAMCTGAIFAAHGMVLKADESVFKHAQALPALATELGLSSETVEPLMRLRQRVVDLFTSPALKDDDTFLAHEGAFTAASLVEWSTEHVQSVLAV